MSRPVFIEINGDLCSDAKNPTGVPIAIADMKYKVITFHDSSHLFGIHDNFENVYKQYSKKDEILFIRFENGKVVVVNTPKDVLVIITNNTKQGDR